MTNENKIQAIYVMLRDFDERTGSRGAENVIKEPENWLELSDAYPFYSAAAALLIDTRAKLDTKITPRTAAAAVGRIIKGAGRDNFRGLFRYGDRYVVCDGFRLLRLRHDITSLPHVENDFNVDGIMKNVGPTAETLPVPAVSELREYIASEKQKVSRGQRIKPYCLAGYIWVNPEYLIDMIQALPGITIYKPSSNTSSIYCTAANGDDGILLPCYPPKVAVSAA